MTSDLAAIRERHHHFGMPESRRGICDACDLFAHINALAAQREECEHQYQEWVARATKAEAHIDALTAKVEKLPYYSTLPSGARTVSSAAVLAILRGEA